MRKTLLKLMTGIMIGGMLLSGCQSKENQETTVETQTQQTATKEETAAEETTNPETEDMTAEDATDGAAEVAQNSDAEDKQQEVAGEKYTYQDMTITIPASWEGKFIIKENENGEDGFSIMQKSSYEKEEGMGFLFGFYKSKDMVDESTGADQLAYTDDYAYYVQEPTDVTCWYEDETIVEEYGEMMKAKKAVEESLVIEAENVRYDAKEYVLPMSYCKPIPEYYLENFGSDMIWIARNEIYARHGRIFDNVFLSNYFESCSWYEGTVASDAFDESVLSQIEKDNLEIIKAQEEKNAAGKTYPQSCQFGKTYQYDLDGDGRKEDICITYREDEENYDFDLELSLEGDLVIPDTVYDLSREFHRIMDVNYFCLNTKEYFITDISPHYEGLEIAVMDYGMSEDLVTHFYTYDGEFNYIGTVGGFPFKEYMNLDGFAWDGCVRGVIRTDLINTCFSYATWYYDYEAKKLEINEDQIFTMVPTGAYKLKKDIEVHTDQDPKSPMRTIKAQDIFFMETDGLEWIKIKGKDGTEGYLYIDEDGKIEETKENPQDIMEGLFFAG